ncbi:hypothetical protein EQH57_0078 [Dictyocoela roeselum]|nr:hypothetical protein EQH57_0078 [Dictyocoela roeselum]
MYQIIWLKGEKGKIQPCINGYIFFFKRVLQSGLSYWACSVKDCSVYAHFLEDGSMLLNKQHEHPPDEKRVYKLQVLDILKEVIDELPFIPGKEAHEIAIRQLSSIYGDNLSIAGQFPSFNSLKSVIYRIKRNYYPSSIEGLIENINLDIFLLPGGGNMLLHREYRERSMVILGDSAFINKFSVQRNFKIYMDGTFKASPNEFYQLYIIHAEFDGQCFPILYCFLQNKTEETYNYLFSTIKEILSQRNISFNPSIVQIDFEYAAFNAIRAVFPIASVKGCFFHFGQAVWRKVVDLHLKTMYNESSNFRECVGMITALALIPLDDIDRGWSIIKSSLLYNSGQIDALFAYVENVWLLDTRPLFSREIWSQHGVFRGRTNNYAEGLHSRINKSINKTRPNFYELTQKLMDLQTISSIEYQRLVDGGEHKERKKIYVEQEKRIYKLMNMYDNRLIDLHQLLIGLSRIIKLNINP